MELICTTVGTRGRPGAGDPFDFSCVKANLDGQVEWIGHYANPRGYSLSHIRNELYGVQADATGVYLFGGTGDESGYSEQIALTNPPTSGTAGR